MKGYVYILSNDSNDLLKIGKTSKHPEIRADQLSKSTASIGLFNVEWFKAVDDIDIAEQILHYIFREYRTKSNKEFFKLSIELAKVSSDKILDNFFVSEAEINKLRALENAKVQLKKARAMMENEIVKGK
jgi:hypothetical protein